MAALPDLDPAKYTYPLDEKRIAKYPLASRDQSKLLVSRKGHIHHQYFFELPNFLEPNDLLILNNTRVIPARLVLTKDTGALIEIFLLSPVTPSEMTQAMETRGSAVWHCMIGNQKRWKPGQAITGVFPGGTVVATLKDPDKKWVELSWEPEDIRFSALLESLGKIPLPPYLNREAVALDKERYQTVYSEVPGAVAAPTAGLHFTANTFEALEKKGIEKAFITLNVGAGTFSPITSTTVADHHMHEERFTITKALVQKLATGTKRIIAVGTTSCRTLESLYWFGLRLYKGAEDPSDHLGQEEPYSQLDQDLPHYREVLQCLAGWMDAKGLESYSASTGIFIVPGYRFQLTQGLITNFHQPGSTLILLIAAFVGSHWETIYQEAIGKDYRFLSYGDSSLLSP